MTKTKKTITSHEQKNRYAQIKMATIRSELIKAEGRGFTEKTPKNIMEDVIKRKINK
ncbi:hypothetical protein ACM9HF_03750 [Colwellia sp. RE-S-Sl-9]